jgi:hypothetical protein
MLPYLFVILAVVGRFLAIPNALGFTPVTAALLYFGARAPRRHMWFPVAMLIGSDIVLSRLVYSYPLTADLMMSWVYYVLAIGFGWTLLQGEPKPLRVGASALAASVSFFLLSNFAVWVVWNMYPKTLEGLVACYVAAIPFFRNALAGDLLFSYAFFLGPVAVAALLRKPAARLSF